MLSDLDLQKSYDSGAEDADIVGDFLEPVLMQASMYMRLAGYFNSGMLAAAARGMASFIANGGTMQIVASPNLSERDIVALNNSSSDEDRQKFFEAKLRDSISDIGELQDLISREHARAMAWMLNSGRLEIRIAVPARGQTVDALFHHKVGVIVSRDGGERISFSGSINETSAAWTKNYEDFKVFREWDAAERDFFRSDLTRFEEYWNGARSSVEIIQLPEAVTRDLLSHAPEEFETLVLRRKVGAQQATPDISKLRNYQEDAIRAWSGNYYRGILAMATGTGKTKTAIGCVNALLKTEKKLFIISTSPYQHIAIQWTREFGKFRPTQLAGKPNWRKLLQGSIDEVILGLKEVSVVTVVQDTAAHPDFVEMVKRLTEAKIPVLFIGDESHGLGAPSLQTALCDTYQFRLGLSATPARYFDEGGTAILEDYFGGDVFSFSISDALAWRDPITNARALCDYNYYPIFVDLTPDEADRYANLSEEIGKATAINNAKRTDETESRLKQLLRDRAMILKSAQNKSAALRQTMQEKTIQSHSLVYCIDSKQLVEAGEILSSNDVIWHRFTGEESTTGSPSERESILKNFEIGAYEALLAMKCLDEGVDVPSAHTAYILASSGNPREFIQRRGRILRPDSPNKVATVYDFVVRRGKIIGDDEKQGQNSFESEINRMLEFASVALNELEVRTLILKEITGGLEA